MISDPGPQIETERNVEGIHFTTKGKLHGEKRNAEVLQTMFVQFMLQRSPNQLDTQIIGPSDLALWPIASNV